MIMNNYQPSLTNISILQSQLYILAASHGLLVEYSCALSDNGTRLPTTLSVWSFQYQRDRNHRDMNEDPAVTTQ